MDGGLEKAQAAAAIARTLDPAGMLKHLANVNTVDECAAIASEATGAAINLLLARCACIGRAQEIATRGDKATTELADLFGCSKKSIERWGAVYRQVVRPRIERDGPAAHFVLEEQSFYLVAVEAAPVVEKPAFELIEEAEERRAADRKFSAARWRRELGLSGDSDEGSTISDAKGFWRAVKRFAKKFEGMDVREAVKSVDPLDVLDDARDALVQIREAVEALEERSKGRSEV